MERAQLEAAVLSELGPIVVPPGLRASAALGKNPGFTLIDGEEVVAERRFASLPSSCEAQLRMLSVVIALAIEHRVASETDIQQPVVEETTEVKPLLPSQQASAIQETTPSQERLSDSDIPPMVTKSPPSQKRDEPDMKERAAQKSWGLRGSGGVGYSFGVLPVPAPIVSAELGVVVWRGWSVELGVMLTDRMRIGFDIEAPEASGSSAPDEAFSQALGHLIAGKAQGCFEPSFEDGALGICAGLGAGRFHARGVEGFRPNPGAGVPWLAAFSRITGRAPARGPFGASLNADIFVNFLRPGVELSGQGSVGDPVDTPIVGGALSFGMFFVLQ